MNLNYNGIGAFKIIFCSSRSLTFLHLFYKSPLFTALGKYVKTCSAALVSDLFFASQIDCLYSFYNTNKSTTILLFAKYEFQQKPPNFIKKTKQARFLKLLL